MKEVSLKDALQQFLKKPSIRDGIKTAKLNECWKELVGEMIFFYTDKIEIKNGKLYIYTTVAALKNELFYEKKNIIEKVNMALKENVINDVLFK